MYTKEIQKQLIENQVVLPANVPSQASISRVLTSDLGYSYKRLRIVPKESLTHNAQERLEEYLTICSACDPRNICTSLTRVRSLKQRGTEVTVTHLLAEGPLKFSVMHPMQLSQSTYFTVFLELTT